MGEGVEQYRHRLSTHEHARCGTGVPLQCVETERRLHRHFLHRKEKPCGVAQRIGQHLYDTGQLRACGQRATHGSERRAGAGQRAGTSHQLCQPRSYLRAQRADRLRLGLLPQVDGAEHGCGQQPRHIALPHLFRVALREGWAIQEGNRRIRDRLPNDASLERRMACTQLTHRPCGHP